jgi:hypothetical protein
MTIEEIYQHYNTNKEELVAKLKLMITLKMNTNICPGKYCNFYFNMTNTCLFHLSPNREKFIYMETNDTSVHCLLKILPKLDSHNKI